MKCLRLTEKKGFIKKTKKKFNFVDQCNLNKRFLFLFVCLFTLRQYFLLSTCKNNHIIYISPENHQIPLHTSTKTVPWYVIVNTKKDTQKHDADEKEFAEIAEMMTTQVTKLINAPTNLSVQTVEKDTWQEVMTMKWKKKE